MKTFYSSIKITPELTNYLDVNNRKLIGLENLSLVNIFVGANNSGKSRFLRELAKIDSPEFHTKEPDSKKLLNYIREISTGLNQIKNQPIYENIIAFDIDGNGKIEKSVFSILELDFLTTASNFINDFQNIIIRINPENQYTNASYRGRNDSSLEGLRVSIRQFFLTNKDKIDYINSFRLELPEYKRSYIPILRSLNNFQSEMERQNEARNRDQIIDIFQRRIVNTYKFNISEKLQILTGQDLYVRIRDMLLGDLEDREIIKKYQEFLGKEVFDQEITLIPKIKLDVVSIKIGKAEERPIYEIGDGIQSLIMLTFPIFISKAAMFFIEEPETHLHPGMQRLFLELILGKSDYLKEKTCQYFITTHSNHFLDLTFDYNHISIYKFMSDLTGNKHVKKIEQINSGDESVLKELGSRKSSVFLTNATIWVEGITDRLYLRKFLDLYQEHHQGKVTKVYEDIDYSFVEYAGNNITHWSFLDSSTPTIFVDRLCGKSFLVTDKDGRTKIPRHEELKKKLQDRYKCLGCREIENILSLNTIEKTLRKYLNDKDFKFSQRTKQKGHFYKEKLIGSFIQSYKPNNKYKDRDGGLAASYKLSFCQNAIEDMQYEDMTPMAKKLAKTIYDFIIEQKR